MIFIKFKKIKYLGTSQQNFFLFYQNRWLNLTSKRKAFILHKYILYLLINYYTDNLRFLELNYLSLTIINLLDFFKYNKTKWTPQSSENQLQTFGQSRYFRKYIKGLQYRSDNIFKYLYWNKVGALTVRSTNIFLWRSLKIVDYFLRPWVTLPHVAFKNNKKNLFKTYTFSLLNKSLVSFDYFYIITVAVHKQPLHHFIVTLLTFSLNPYFQFSKNYFFLRPHLLYLPLRYAFFVNTFFCKAQKF